MDGFELSTGGPGVLTIAALVELDPAALPETSLVEIVGRLDEQVAWLHSVRAAHLAELARRHLDDPLPEPAPGEWHSGRDDSPQWERESIGLRCGVTAYEARVRVETALALQDRLPATASLLARGAVSWAHAVALSQETTLLDDAQAGEVERRVHADARAVTAGQCRRRARRLAAATAPPVDPDATVERSLTAWSDDTSCTLAVRLDREGGEVVAVCLDSLATRTDAEDHRSIATRRADALVELCQSRLDAGDLPLTAAGARPHLLLQVSLASLAGAADVDSGCATGAASGAAGLAADLPLETVRRIACDAGVSELLHGDHVVDLGREHRFPTAGLRRRLEARDGGCRFPTCERPARRCHAHHVRHWADGGSTAEDNVVLVCSRHHHLLHEGGWQLTFDGQAASWFEPDGTEHLAPSPLARPPRPDPDFYRWLQAPPSPPPQCADSVAGPPPF